MSVVLRPMRLGEILDRTFQIYKERFWVFVGLSLLPAAGMTLLQFLNLFRWKINIPNDLLHILGINLGYVAYLIGEYHCSLFFHALVWPALAMAASRAYLGDQPGIWQSVRACGARWKSWIGLALLLQLGVVILAEVAAVALLIGAAALAAWLSKESETFMDPFMTCMTGLLIIAGYVSSLWLGTLYLGAVPAWCNEGLGLRKTFKRSRTLMHKSRWRVLILRFIPVTMILVLDVAASASIRLAAIYASRALHRPLWHYFHVYMSIYLVCEGIISALLTPVFPIALTLLYYDQRIRKEGFDIELMMQTAGMHAPEAAPVAVPAADTEEARPAAAVPLEGAGA